MSEKLYRLGVGICLLNKEGLIFAGERLNNLGAWQMPQGGIDEGEDIHVAAKRELREEIGTDAIEIFDSYPEPLRYDLPLELQMRLWDGKYVGQEQQWVYARFLGQDSDIDLHKDDHPEFRAWRWMQACELVNLRVLYKAEIYQKVLARFL